MECAVEFKKECRGDVASKEEMMETKVVITVSLRWILYFALSAKNAVKKLLLLLLLPRAGGHTLSASAENQPTNISTKKFAVMPVLSMVVSGRQSCYVCWAWHTDFPLP